MSAPFFKFGMFGDEASFVVAFVIGIGFGFFLERAGFGSGRKLAAQFYLRDMSVLKVMFTAIITAMTGLYLLSRLGVVDLSLVYLVPTFLVPQIVGGLLLGIGFTIGGYCPGTSCVSAVTGRIDGMVYVLGMIAGLVGFAEFYPYLQGFANSTPMGQITLPKLFDLPYGLLVFAVVLMAIGAFMFAEWAEKKFGGKEPDPEGSLIAKTRRLTPVRVLALGLLERAWSLRFPAIRIAEATQPSTPGTWQFALAKDWIQCPPRISPIGSSRAATTTGSSIFAIKKTLRSITFLPRKICRWHRSRPIHLHTTIRSFCIRPTAPKLQRRGSSLRRRVTRASICSTAECAPGMTMFFSR